MRVGLGRLARSKRLRWFLGGVLAIALLLHGWLTWRIHRFSNHFCEAAAKGASLQHDDVVIVHEHLLDDLGTEQRAGYEVSTRPYDVFDWEFPRCTHTAFIETASRKQGLRLRFDPWRNKFHVVGSWTVH